MPSNCPRCRKTFARPEHLRRHVLATHQREQPFACDVCGKRFARSDSRRRHRQNHRELSGSQWAEHEKRTQRACDNCAVARSKCDGADTCSRCISRQLICAYNHPRARSRLTTERPSSPAIAPTMEGVLRMQEDARPSVSALRPTALGPATCSWVVPGHTSDAEMSIDATTPVPDLRTRPSMSTFARAGAWPSNAAMNVTWQDNMNWLPVADDTGIFFDHDLDFFAHVLLSVNDMNEGQFGEFFPVANQPSQGGTTTVSEDPLHSPTSSRPADSPVSSRRCKKAHHTRYVDGQGARDSLQETSTYPSVPRSGFMTMIPPPTNLTDNCIVFDFPPSATYSSQFPSTNASRNVGIQKYLEMRQQFNNLATSDAASNSIRGPMSLEFPPIEYVEHCFNLFFESLDSEIPVIHHTVWEDHSSPWFLFLAAVTVGSSFDSGENGRQINLAFQEFLRRSLQSAATRDQHLGTLALAQACYFHVIGMFQQPGEYLRLRLLDAVGNLKIAVATLDFSSTTRLHQTVELQQESEVCWRDWIRKQSRVRIGLHEWQVNMILALSTDIVDRPALPKNSVEMPCNAKLWQADTEERWRALYEQIPHTRTFWSTLQHLFINHAVDDEIENFARISLIYGVLGRVEEVAQNLQRPFGPWNPLTDNDHPSQEQAEVLPDNDLWLPGDPQYSAWRNSACDCLDTLHWKANSEIAASGGAEETIVLHLHFSRLILLCPFKDVIRFASDAAQVPLSCRMPFQLDRNDRNEDIAAPYRPPDSILKWLTLDGHKGRLSLVHAGAVFWHIRRYSEGLLHEPFAAFLAAVVIWTYGRYHPALLASRKASLADQCRSRGLETRGDSSVEDLEDDMTPMTILIDRPCDDEIVQVFIRKGFDMSAAMCGAGDISSVYGLRRILAEALKILRFPQYASFSQCRDYQRVLAGLYDRSSSDPTRLQST